MDSHLRRSVPDVSPDRWNIAQCPNPECGGRLYIPDNLVGTDAVHCWDCQTSWHESDVHETEFPPIPFRVTGTWFDWKRRYVNGKPSHSSKPDEFYNLVELVAPGPYLEMFARRRRFGWHSWGNEVESDVDVLRCPECDEVDCNKWSPDGVFHEAMP